MKKDYPIIGIAGSNGSGKDTVAAMLAERFNFFSASATQMLGDELVRQDKPTSRKNKAALSASWRKQYGKSAIVDRAIEEYEEHHGEKTGMCVGSLRHPGEALKVQELGGIVVWTDAEARVRYERVSAVKREGREHEDMLGFDEWLADELREMEHHSGDDTTLSVGAVKDLRDITIANNKNDIEAFKDQAEVAVRDYIESYSKR